MYVGTTTGNSTWQNWNQDWTSLGTVSGNFNINTTASSTYATGGWVQWNTAYTETEEQRAEREERQRRDQADWQRRYEEQQREHQAVKARAEELLVALLSDEQAETWRQHDWFTVRGSSTGRAYRVRRGVAGNVDRMAEVGDEAEVTYCAHPPGLPAEDVNLAQLLLLATDEEEFLRVANATPRRLRPVQVVDNGVMLERAVA
jgi:hypothetical protein